jgi:hypothetical protein
MKKKILALILFCLTTPAHAGGPRTGNDHISGCEAVLTKSNDDAFEQGFCMGAVSMGLATTPALPGVAHACPPQGVTNYQGVRVLVNYMHTRPERLNETVHKNRYGLICLSVALHGVDLQPTDGTKRRR